MARQKDVGVFKVENGLWAYRYTLVIDGEKVSQRKTTDAFGNKLTTKRDALKARAAAIDAAYQERCGGNPIIRKTVKCVYEEYCANGRSDRAYATIRKQDSLWNNHISKKFGRRYVDNISVAEVNDYLAELYYKDGYSYKYTESFLKMFYLIFGQAYSRNYLGTDAYNKLCVNKDTKIKMPKSRSEDDSEIVTFSKQELAVLDEYFKGTNAETAYLLGRYCGLRINECFGLKWSNINLREGTILIDRQMQYQDGLIKLVRPKTHNSKRTIYMNDVLLEYFKELAAKRKEYEKTYADLRAQNQKMIEDLNGEKIPSTDLVNCLPNGVLQTVNSFKYPSRDIIQRFGIDFKFHYLRHTYGTKMADMNTPAHLLCNQMGHGNINVTQRYYLSVSREGIDVLRCNLNNL